MWTYFTISFTFQLQHILKGDNGDDDHNHPLNLKKMFLLSFYFMWIPFMPASAFYVRVFAEEW